MGKNEPMYQMISATPRIDPIAVGSPLESTPINVDKIVTETMTTKFASKKNQYSDRLARPFKFAYLLKARVTAVAKSTFNGAKSLLAALPLT